MTQPQRRVPPFKPIAGYRRSMSAWYLRYRSPYRWYMLRELTCVAVGYYALLLICGLSNLRAGEAAFNGFIAGLRSPLWLTVNLVALALMLFHAVTWFLVMPKTTPMLFVGGKRVPGNAIISGGLAAFAVASLAVWIAFWATKP
jgi:fumarate reductase subunit C